MAFACGVGLVGCGNDNTLVSKDLDGDGVISSWETVFDSSASSSLMGDSSSAVGEIEYIGSASELKSINQDYALKKIYVLKNDINLGGEEVCVNLGSSTLYGNGHIISDFKLGKYYPEDYVVVDEESGKTQERGTSGTRCLFYGGESVYDVRLFVGCQNISISSDDGQDCKISPFVNTRDLEGVSVKGKIQLNIPRIDGVVPNIDMSLLYTNKTVDGGELDDIQYGVYMDNVSVDGCMQLIESENGINYSGRIGSLASELPKGSTLIDGYAQVDMKIPAENEMHIGGAVGVNNGFVSTCTVTGKMALSYQPSKTPTENIGGIVGTNYNVAEIKNCTTNVEIDFGATQSFATAGDNTINIGGIVGKNDGGVLECDQNDAKIFVDNAHKVSIGGIAGNSTRGIISYMICRGSIDIQNTNKVYVAQVSGFSELGLFEKIITTTSIKVNNSEHSSQVYAGMVTIFENVNQNEPSSDNSPYFQKILVDGGTDIFMKNSDTFVYELGLRNKFRKLVSIEEDGDGVIENYEDDYPAIFETVRYTSGCYIRKYNDNVLSSDVVAKYADKISGNASVDAGNLMTEFGFNNCFNHQEVNSGSVSLSQLSFTLSESKKKTQSYFYRGKSNGDGTAIVENNYFTKSYTHEVSSKGSCKYDTEDTYYSFLYGIVRSATGTRSNCAFKVSDDFLNILTDDDSEETILTHFAKVTQSAFNHLDAPATCVKRNENMQDIEQDGDITDDRIRYLEFTFENSSQAYTLLMDVESLVTREENPNSSSTDYIIYLMINTNSK